MSEEKPPNKAEDLENGTAPQDVDVEVKDGKKKKKEEEEEMKVVGFCEYYRYADAVDGLLIAIGMLFSVIKGSSWPVMMILFGQMTEKLGMTDQDKTAGESVDLVKEMRFFAFWYIGVGFGQIVAGYFATCFLNISAERQVLTIRREYFRAMMRQEIGWYDSMSTGELTSRLASDIEKIRDGLSDKSGIFTTSISCFLFGMLSAFYYEWRMSLVIMATAPVMAGSAAIFAKWLADFSASEQSAYAQAGAVAEEVIAGIRTVVSFGGENKEVERYTNKLDITMKAGQRSQFMSGASLALTYGIMYLTYALAFWYGAKLNGEMKASPADILIAFFNIMIGAWGLGLAAPSFKSLSIGRGAAFNVYHTIDRESKINPEEESGKILVTEDLQGKIEFSNCTFSYPTRPDTVIMSGFNMTLQPAKTHALVGASGCGKSTAVNLIERFYDVAEGAVYLDGHDIRTLNLKWLREQIGLVGQEPALFSTTIEENLRYGREGVSTEEIVEACKKAFAHDFISNLPNGYQTLCGERGTQLSGGQKQRIAIARALVRNPKILLLDEATSALDNKSQKVVQQALDKAREGRTTLMIAHRLTTIVDVDEIFAISGGRVVEQGTHQVLMKQEGVYHNLVTYQQDVAEAQDAEMADRYADVLSSKVLPEVNIDQFRAEKSYNELRQRNVASKKEDEAKVKVLDPVEEEESVKPATFTQIIKQCNKYEYFQIALGCVGAAINGATMPVFAVLFANVLYDLIDLYRTAAAIKNGDTSKTLNYSKTNMWAGYFVLLGVMSGISNFMQAFCMGLMSESFTRRLRIRSFKAILRQNMSFFDEPANSTGALTTRLSKEASAVKDATGPRVGLIVQVIVAMAAGLIIAFIVQWKIALVCLACVPLVVVGGAIRMWEITGTTNGVAQLYEASGKTASQAIENIRTVASLGLEEHLLAEYSAALRAPTRTAQRKAHIVGISMGLSEAFTFFTFAAVFWYGSYLMSKGQTSFQDCMEVFSAIIFSGMMVGESMAYFGDFKKATVAAAKLFRLIEAVPPIDAYSTSGVNNFPVEGELKFCNVEFNYPTRASQPVLQGLSIIAKRGQTIGLVGESGCGKSTCIQLTERFYDTLRGSITLDGHDLADINVGYLRKQLGLVQQEPILFDTTIADNIKYGDLTRDISEAEVRSAAEAANIHTFISTLPDGYQTLCGERGTQLSGGQKQRIAIARALVRNPKILLLDEATSALDTESEKIVQEALDKAREGRTCIVIAHRLSTIHTADYICVIQEGMVTEQGTHAELMSRKGVYYHLNIKTSEG